MVSDAETEAERNSEADIDWVIEVELLRDEDKVGEFVSEGELVADGVTDSGGEFE